MALDLSWSDYRGDPILRMASQSGHFVIGFGGAWCLAMIWWPLWVVVPVVYAAHELRQFLREDARAADCIWDCAFVASGLVLALLLLPVAPPGARLFVPTFCAVLFAYGFELPRLIVEKLRRS